jgi:hypothetical protein
MEIVKRKNDKYRFAIWMIKNIFNVIFRPHGRFAFIHTLKRNADVLDVDLQNTMR